MNTALILTTINIPTVLSLYRRLDPSVHFFVACDEKTPQEAYDFCASIPDCEVYSPDAQRGLDWECSPLIGWNTIARRNIALLEALRWGADLIISIDDDNIPISEHYFEHFRRHVWSGGYDYSVEFSGLKVSGGWFDPGQLSFPRDGIDPVCQRGFPQHLFDSPTFAPVINARVGVAQGAVLGDPDTSAVDRISRHPTVHQVSELLRAGVVSDPRTTWAPLNSQNIAFLRELAPCFLMVPQFGRYDDIFAGLIAQRIMRERGLFVHYGQPFVWQQRNSHDLVRDLRAELWGMENIIDFTDLLDIFSLTNEFSAVQQVSEIWSALFGANFISKGVLDLSKAWCADCQRAMA